MDDPSIKKRLIDLYTDEHEYDEVQELPEESSIQPPESSASNPNTNGARHSGPGTATGAGTSAVAPQSPAIVVDSVPELPAPKQKSVKNSKSKQKQKQLSNKSKIPRSPSLASSLSSLASSLSGHRDRDKDRDKDRDRENHQSVPPQTPPLPASYKQSQMNGDTTTAAGGGGVLSAPATPTSANNNNASNSNNNNNGSIMGGGVQLNQSDNGNPVLQAPGERSSLNLTPLARDLGGGHSQEPTTPATTPTTPSQALPKSFQYLTLTVRKDGNGYGMKVSGDNPVFVESVKPGGAAEVAGLVAGDMILRVNGYEVRQEKHPTVVGLIKASTTVELAVKRSQKQTRPTSVTVVTPSTPILSGRDRTASITGPQPVDSIKRREMETYKIQTLQKMLEQEKLNLERLKSDQNNPSYKLSEANIRKLREQLHQVGAEDAPTVKLQAAAGNKNTALLTPNQIQHLSASATHSNQQFHHLHHHHNLHNNNYPPQQQPASTSPAFLSLLPRSLSSLSLGTRKNKIEKDLTTPSPFGLTADFLQQQRMSHQAEAMSQSMHQHTSTPTSQHPYFHAHQQQQHRFKDSGPSKGKNKFLISRSLIEEDVPPPLPQRNPPRQLNLDLKNGNASPGGSHLVAPVSDLDRATSPQLNRSQQQPLPSSTDNSPSNAKSKRSKIKTKALSDPKMSTQMFLQMESACAAGQAGGSIEVDGGPPPLPPRLPGMMTEDMSRGSCQNLAQPNSVGASFNYPLVSTTTAVQNDIPNIAFPLSQRPNIVQQLQHYQQQLSGGGQATGALGLTPNSVKNKHRRVGSSPDNMHPRHPDRLTKTTSGSWEIVEKDGESSPPGTPPPPYLSTSHMTVLEDPNENCRGAGATGPGVFIESHQFTPMAGASSPIPTSLHSGPIQAAQSNDTQKEIISMEDENSSDIEEPFIDENGPFNNLTRLLEAENVTFLAIFLNYVISNSDPAPLLFYLITELYKEGTSKDMRKWAYEIHSTFLVPRAPLSWYRQDESLAREVDNVLQLEYDKVEILRTVFLRSRKRAKDLISEQLREFQQKRTAGLGTIYGPTDAHLAEAKTDKLKEQIIDKYLMPNLHTLIEDENGSPPEDVRKVALCSALSTVIYRIFNTRPPPSSIVERVHHFVSRDKSFKSRIMGKNRKMNVRGHPLVLRQYYEVTHCNHCQTIIWGVSPQGYHCTDCKLNIHRQCSKVVDESCPGPLPQAKRLAHNDKISKFMGKIRPRNSDVIGNEKRSRQDEDLDVELTPDRGQPSIVRQPSDRRPDANVSIRSNGNTSCNTSALNTTELQSSFHGSCANDSINQGGGAGCNMDLSTSVASTAPSSSGSVSAGLSVFAELNALDAVDKDARRERQHPKHKSAPVSVNRSESYKERLSNKRNRNSRRKTSDPSLSSRPNDEQLDLGLSNANYVASSNSSLSSAGGSESPSTSMEHFAGAGAAGGPQAPAGGFNQSQHPHLLIQQHAQQYCQQDSFQAGMAGAGGSSAASNSSFWNAGHPLARQWNLESDDEDDVNEADWSSMVAAEMLAALTDAEKKRQEIINEIYQTERNHVRTLKLLDRLFFLPLYESGLLSQDHLLLLFPPALLSLREIHGNFEQSLKQRRIEHNHVVNTIGDLLSEMFDGQSGVVLCEYAAQFCARQQIALEALKEKRNKDEALQKLLKKSESHKACRRLELKDLLPTVLQRLTKYPLLFENLYKVTVRLLPENTNEAEAIQRAVESSKRILVEVNQAVKTAEDAHKLQNIQRKLDRSSYDKEEFKKLDLTQHHLIHDGNLTIKKNPSVQLHGLLFENMIVLLTKQDDKYYLKNLYTLHLNNRPVSPIMSIDAETLVRQEAADKNSFFLIKTKTTQMLELRAPSSSECKTWFKHISDAAARQSKNRSKNASNSHDTSISDPALTAIPHSNTKESLELTTDCAQPMAATATVTTTPLAPMLPIATVTPAPATNNSNTSSLTGVQLRNPQRETAANESDGDYVNSPKQRSTQNDVNRSMSIRSTGEPSHKYSAGGAEPSDVTLRHSQSARESARPGSTGEERNSTYGMVGGHSKRDSASIVCSNNSNNTRTLLMQSPLVDPTAIQVSISPAHTAEPVLTPGEKLRRLDASIRSDLLEKQKIICDIFRLPVEHYDQIVDIAMMPEAPKDSADIALAAYDQIQTLTKMLNEYMHVTPEQEVSAVSTVVCGHCHEKEKLRKKVAPSSSFSSSPPPLPPPNRQLAQAQAQIPPSRVMPKLQTLDLDEVAIHEDDDGYCEIDELRLPAIPPKPHDRPTTPLAPFKTEHKSSQPVIIETAKRQSIDAVGLAEGLPVENKQPEAADNLAEKEVESEATDKLPTTTSESCNPDKQKVEEDHTKKATESTIADSEASATTGSGDARPSQGSELTADDVEKPVADKKEDNEIAIEQVAVPKVDSSTQTSPIEAPKDAEKPTGGSGSTCGPNRIQHASVLEPSVPCHALSGILTVLNEQISMLLPKINERDMERERLRKENQHLRELLSALHDRQRVDEVKETQFDLSKLMHAEDVECDDDIDAISNSSLTPTPTPIPTVTASPSPGGQVQTAEAMRVNSTEDEE
ncbi:uncharacterized protein LOC108093793 isoform X2 [Drosophila ficusphila]|uniref:uncharacterized protein LOC108093793 isoform X2 n=1 Tax=Drosophila ficusphila TaxID=30025 RepID=UPI0007E7CB7E|nr:uncharacterized protein LOC108093793 isoform X2 [Drosophila ficusphila]